MLYLDNSSTTPIHPEVKNGYGSLFDGRVLGNPSSKFMSSVAENAKNAAVKNARNSIASLLGCDHTEIIFTSGFQPKVINMIIKGLQIFYQQQGNHIITSKVEHPSVLETANT